MGFIFEKRFVGAYDLGIFLQPPPYAGAQANEAFDAVGSVATSFPGFFEVLGALGAEVEWISA